MSIPPWHEEPISREHNREAFNCGDAALNEFLRRYARQTHEQGGAKTFLAVRDDDPTLVLGFYSLSPASVKFSSTPAVVTRGLARHDVPVFRLGRLAVDKSMQAKGEKTNQAKGLREAAKEIRRRLVQCDIQSIYTVRELPSIQTWLETQATAREAQT